MTSAMIAKTVRALSAAAVLTAGGLATASAQTVAVLNARIATMSDRGVIEGGTLLFEDGRITGVGRDVSVPAGARTIDADGDWVTPGIFAPTGRMASVEVGAVSGTRDDQVEAAEAGFSAAFDIQYGINPRSTTIDVARTEGLTRAGVTPMPSDSLFGGLAALIHTAKGDDAVFKDKAAMVVSLGQGGAERAGGSRGAAMVKFIRAIEEAARYRDMADTSDWHGEISRTDAQALVPVTRGEIPLLIRVHRASDITEIIQLTQRYTRLDVILYGAAEGWMVADAIKRAGIPVVIDPMSNLPAGFDKLGATQHNAARLIEAGVSTAFTMSGFDTHMSFLVRQVAGNAVANGTDWADAMKAITLNPARIYGVDNRLGSLSAGKMADVVIWDGDPLETRSNPRHVFIEGKETPMMSRQMKLQERYRDLSNAEPPFAYRR